MPFWSSEKLKEKLKGGNLIAPCDLNRVKYGFYELSVGPEAFLTSDPSGQKQEIRPGSQLVIPPWQFGVIITEETVTLPDNAIGFISIKTNTKFRGLVNVSGFHVDPGFSGRLKFAVYNAGSQNIVLSRYQEAFLIWFSDLDRATSDVYRGEHFNQQEITAEDVMRIQGREISQGKLLEEFRELKNSVSALESSTKYRLNLLTSLFVGVLVALLTAIIGMVFRLFPLPITQAPTVQQPQAVIQTGPAAQEKTSSVPASSEVKKPAKGSAPSMGNVRKTE